MISNAGIVAKFEHHILSIRFLENARIEVEDVKEIYEYGNMWASGEPYGIVFEPTGHYELSDEAVENISLENPNDSHIIAKAYVINDKESALKVHMHLLFDHPKLKPSTFKTYNEARTYIEAAIKIENGK